MFRISPIRCYDGRTKTLTCGGWRALKLRSTEMHPLPLLVFARLSSRHCDWSHARNSEGQIPATRYMSTVSLHARRPSCCTVPSAAVRFLPG
jgi:hypothetical protein